MRLAITLVLLASASPASAEEVERRSIELVTVESEVIVRGAWLRAEGDVVTVRVAERLLGEAPDELSFSSRRALPASEDLLVFLARDGEALVAPEDAVIDLGSLRGRERPIDASLRFLDEPEAVLAAVRRRLARGRAPGAASVELLSGEVHRALHADSTVVVRVPADQLDEARAAAAELERALAPERGCACSAAAPHGTPPAPLLLSALLLLAADSRPRPRLSRGPRPRYRLAP